MPCDNCACPDCGAARDPVGQLREWCRARGHWVGPDDRVPESVAALLLGRSSKTLANWRCDLEGPPFLKIRGRIYYRLADLAAATDEN